MRPSRTFRASPPFRRDRAGFTLTEVMIVLVILMTIAGVGILAIGRSMESARKREAAIKIGEFKTPIEMFRLHVGRLPLVDEGLEALLVCPGTLPIPEKWEGPYLSISAIPPDPWGNPYQYVAPGTHSNSEWEVWSLGPNGVDGDEDDIGSWQR